MTEIKSCPFCGGEAADGTMRFSTPVVYSDGTSRHETYFVNCIACGASNACLSGHRSKDHARKHWNKRSEVSANTTSMNPEIDIFDLAFRISAAIRSEGNHVDVIRRVLRDVAGGVLQETKDPVGAPGD